MLSPASHLHDATAHAAGARGAARVDGAVVAIPGAVRERIGAAFAFAAPSAACAKSQQYVVGGVRKPVVVLTNTTPWLMDETHPTSRRLRLHAP